MAIQLPTFTIKEILTAAKLQQLRNAIAAKFQAITGADIAWPLVAGGNIDFNQSAYSIIGLRTFWGLINADEYSTFQAACDAAAGGGCVFIPPNTTITTDGVDISNTKVTIMGCGPSSVLQLNSGASSGYLLRTGTGSLVDIMIADLTLDGNSTAAANKGIVSRRVHNFTMHNVHLKNFKDAAVHVTNSGTQGESSTNVMLSELRFEGNLANDILVDDVDGLTINDVRSADSGGVSIYMEPVGAGSFLRDIRLDDVEVDNPTGIGIDIVGVAGTASTNFERVSLSDVRVYSPSSHGIRVGDTSKILQHVTLDNCHVYSAGDVGIIVNADSGHVVGCYAPEAASKGLDLLDSDTVTVQGCNFRDATTYGIDLDGTSNCNVSGNVVSGAGTQATLKTNVTNLRCGNNYGEIGPAPATAVHDSANYAATGTGDVGYSETIFGGTLKVGDTIRFTLGVGVTIGTGGTQTIQLQLGGTTISTFSTTVAGDYVWEAIVVVAALSGAGSAIIETTTITNAGSGAASGSATIDWTTDKAVTFNVSAITASSTLSVRRPMIHMIGAK